MTIGSLTIRQLLDNYERLHDRVIRTNGIITLLDLRADNYWFASYTGPRSVAARRV